MTVMSVGAYRERHTHNHDGDGLTIGCPACIYRSQQAQECARWKEAPTRRCTWRFTVKGRRFEFDLEVPVPTGAEPWQVDEWYAGETGPAISEALGQQYTADEAAGPLFWEACHTIECVRIGPVVAAPPVEHPSLFWEAL